MKTVIFALILTVVLLIDISSETKSEKECKGKREFWGCDSGTKECRRLCENKELRKNQTCDKECHLTCTCEAGFLRKGANGDCIPEAECSKS